MELTTVPEKVPTNGTHIVKIVCSNDDVRSVCSSDDQVLTCRSPIQWTWIDDWAGRTPQHFTDETRSAMKPEGQKWYDKPGCPTPNRTWRAPHGALVPQIKVDYNATTTFTFPRSPANDKLACELLHIARELADKVTAKDKRQTAILNKHTRSQSS